MNTTERVLEFVRDFTKREGFPPSRRDIMVGCGISSTSVVQYHIKRLAESEDLVLLPGLARGILVGDEAV